MTDHRAIATDASFVIAYVGTAALIVAVTATLLVLSAVGAEMGGHHSAAAILTALGWAGLPFAPRLYARLAGRPFTWRADTAIDGVEA